MVRRLIDEEYETIGLLPPYSTRELALISLALFGGLGIERLVDPDAVTEHTLDTTLSLLYDVALRDRASEPEVS